MWGGRERTGNGGEGGSGEDGREQGAIVNVGISNKLSDGGSIEMGGRQEMLLSSRLEK